MTVESKESPGNESMFSRWSRRKQQVRLQEGNDEAPRHGDSVSQGAPLPEDVTDEPELLTDADMPDIETLTEDSDFSGFMSPGVSDELRNLALRKLFRAPAFNIRDGLDEYDEDYTHFEKLGDIVTCDMKHQIEMQEKKQREAIEQEQQAAAEAEVTEDELIEDFDETEEVDLVLAESADEPHIRKDSETGDITTKVNSDNE